MEIYCTRPDCDRPLNSFADLDDLAIFKTAQQKYCLACGMPLILAGRYFPIKLLGRGGFGTAFLAIDRHTPTRRKCVVKQFQPASNLNPEALALAQSLFEREAEVLEDLGARHPQIPDLYAFFPLLVPNRAGGKDSQFFYLVQEFIDGQTLADKLTVKGAFSEIEVVEIVQEILKILEFVHSNGSIHRDIKPSNIIQHKNGLYYLLDFGAVKQVAQTSGNSQSTGIYSVGYAPPEQMMGKQVFPATDLYALGVTAINLLTGKDPEDLYDASHNTWQWRQDAPQVGDRFADFLDRLLQHSPLDRFRSAEEARQVLLGGVAIAHSSTQLQTTQLPPSFQAPPTIQPTPPPISPAIAQPAPLARPRFSTLEQIAMASFTGFEGALLSIGAIAQLGMPGAIVACMAMGGIVFCQWQRIIEGKDFVIFAAISLALMLFPSLRGGLTFPLVAAIALVAGAALVAALILFKLIYQLISRLVSH